MIRQATQDFDERLREIERFFKLLAQLAKPNARFAFEGGRARLERDVDPEWLKMLKATSFLMLYNLVEASVRRGVAALYEVMQRENRTCEELREEVRRIWVDQRYRRIDRHSASLRTYQDAAGELVTHVISQLVIKLDGQVLPTSGNLNADNIRKICQLHGISVRTHPRAKGGEQLTTVVEQRNSLAHGVLSFRECGRQYTISELQSIKRQVVVFTRSILRNIERYIRNRAYLA